MLLLLQFPIAADCEAIDVPRYHETTVLIADADASCYCCCCRSWTDVCLYNKLIHVNKIIADTMTSAPTWTWGRKWKTGIEGIVPHCSHLQYYRMLRKKFPERKTRTQLLKHAWRRISFSSFKT